MTLRVAVIGAGIVGAISALEAVRDGHHVIIIDPDSPGGEQAASYGNAAWISEGTVLPVSTPGLWRKIPGYLLDPEGPFSIRWSYLPKVLPWLIRFVRAGSTVSKVQATARARRTLVATAISRYRALADEAGLSHLLHHRGLLYVYPSRTDFEAEALEWRLRRELGLTWDELDGPALRRFEPGLGPAYGFGALLKDGANLSDPGAFVAGIVKHAVSLGATLLRARATDFRVEGERLVAVTTDDGEVSCNRALICAGIHSKELAHKAGDAVPIESERGYHVVVADPEYVPQHPVMPSDGKMGLTMTDSGLRVAGQVELGGIKAAPDWRRAEILLDHLARVFPSIERDPARIKRWMGHRPSTPDGLPCIGPSTACADILHGFGHGHSGICMAPVSARLLVDLAGGKSPAIDPKPFSVRRFR
ncbi:NAD(P)/FAD-dependent oxidoreductase [Microvirga brassicacearum]|uniref:FAD-binding oxidoreductase n=1 Tax=Microvirga brassicacearum TaxID=2580413 RepID=A0A5N3P884_9HYPH|nr:FAD-binding oxidoreductase [Microvirga brassicacearum]KAB0265942.1 FAD-binding oxidoreductase [Microvirga brassicacearum]